MMLCYSKTRKIKYFLDPPPQKKRLKDTNDRDMSTRTSDCLYHQAVTWIFTRSRLSRLLSNPFIENYYLILVVFSGPHFSIYDIFYTLENTQSFNERATHFKYVTHTARRLFRSAMFVVFRLTVVIVTAVFSFFILVSFSHFGIYAYSVLLLT